jgi:Cu/Ag efflux pump CusA
MIMTRMQQERRRLQQAVALIALLPVAVGLYGVLFGQALTGDTVSISAESHFRFLSGLLLGIGILFWSTVPRIELHTGRFRLLTLLVVIGGMARLTGLALTGLPSLFMIGGLFIELVVTPALCLWQTRVANRYADAFGVA